MSPIDSRVLGVAALAALAGHAAAQVCVPRWSEQFVLNGPDFGVNGLGVVTQGGLPGLYIGGWFANVGATPASRIARWNGTAWSSLGSGIPVPFNSHGFQGCCADVFSVCGPIPGVNGVYIAGEFITAGGATVESIGRWDGTQWHDLAGGVQNLACFDCSFRVYSAIVFDEGSGPVLYAAGTFDLAGGVAASRVAKWNGQTWTALGDGLGTAPGSLWPCWARSLAAFDDGTGMKLYAAGFFSKAGSSLTDGIARWDGTSWSDVGGGLGQVPGGHLPNANALAVFNDGLGPALYLAGYFELVGGLPARNIAKWDGSHWSALGAGVGSGVNDQVFALEAFNDGRGPGLFVGGTFTDAGGQPAQNLARWSGWGWSEVGGGVAGGAVQAMDVYDDGAGPALMVGGWFTSAGPTASQYLAKWEGCTPCYANCDASTTPPVLNIQDFGCFIARFGSGHGYANCDGSTIAPVLNINDFICFLTRFAGGCP